MFNFDLDKFVNRCIPTQERQPVRKSFLRVLLFPFIDLWAIASAYRTATLQDLTTTIQTDVLQTRLRLLCPDVGSFKAFIKTQWDNILPTYAGYIGEHHKKDFDYFLSEAIASGTDYLPSERNLPYDYYVIVPTTYSTNQLAIEALMNRFRPLGKRYLLIFQNITS